MQDRPGAAQARDGANLLTSEASSCATYRARNSVAGERMSHVADSAETASRPMTKGGLLVLALGAIDFGFEQSMIVPALPQFAQTYDASLIAVGWLATAYLLTAIVAVPLLSRLGDLYGKRPVSYTHLTLPTTPYV